MYVHNLLEVQDLYQVVINNLSDGIFLVDRERNIHVWNETAEQITGHQHDDILSHPASLSLLDGIDRTGAPVGGMRCPITATFHDGMKRADELFLRHKRGYRVPVLIKTVPVIEEDEITYVMGIITDNSVHVKQNDLVNSLSRLMMTDQLTGLSNKLHTTTVVDARLEEYRHSGRRFGVVFINVDDFTDHIHMLGYEAGNRILVGLAERFRTVIRRTDFIGRWAGEEFVGVFDAPDEEHLRQVSEKLRGIVSVAELDYMGTSMQVTASIGASMAGIGDQAGELIERAMSLMHVSRISGQNMATIG